jgi:hypothetical protein
MPVPEIEKQKIIDKAFNDMEDDVIQKHNPNVGRSSWRTWGWVKNKWAATTGMTSTSKKATFGQERLGDFWFHFDNCKGNPVCLYQEEWLKKYVEISGPTNVQGFNPRPGNSPVPPPLPPRPGTSAKSKSPLPAPPPRPFGKG